MKNLITLFLLGFVILSCSDDDNQKSKPLLSIMVVTSSEPYLNSQYTFAYDNKRRLTKIVESGYQIRLPIINIMTKT